MDPEFRCKLCLQCFDRASVLMHEVDPVAASMIEKYLWTDLTRVGAKFIDVICNGCWKALTDFHTFYCTIEKLHGQLSNTPAAETVPMKEEHMQTPEEEEDVLTGHGQPALASVFIKCDEFSEELDVASGKKFSEKETVSHGEEDPETDDESVEGKKNTTRDSIDPQHQARQEEDAIILRFYRRIVCEVCDLERMTRGQPAIEYGSWQELLVHTRKQHADLPSRVRTFVRCPVCDRKVRPRVQLLRHREFHEHPERFRCAICSEVHENMKEHLQNKHQERQFECDECGKKFPFKERLSVHRKKMHQQKDIICDQCQKPFSRYTIEDHKRSVHTARFACEQCPKTFKIRFRFLQHLEKHHGDGTNSTSVPCAVCGKVMRDKYDLKRHVTQLHTDQPPVSCGSCGKSFKNKRNLATHMTNVCAATARSFGCEICGRKFRRRTKLKEHLATHTGKPLYRCSFCPEEFRQDTHMYYHRKKVHHEQWLEMQRQRKEGMRFKVPTVAS